jgi:hypothetical protein
MSSSLRKLRSCSESAIRHGRILVAAVLDTSGQTGKGRLEPVMENGLSRLSLSSATASAAVRRRHTNHSFSYW